MWFRQLSVVIIVIGLGVATLAVSPGPAAAVEVYTVSLPERNWALALSSPKIRLNVIEQSLRYKKGKPVAYFMGEDRANQRFISAFMQPVKDGNSADACRKKLWARTKRGGAEIRVTDRSSKGDWSTVQYTATKRLKKKGVHKSRHFRAYYARDKVCIDLHVTDYSRRKKPRKSLAAIFNMVSFKPMEDANERQFPIVTGEGSLAFVVPKKWRSEMLEQRAGKHTEIKIYHYASKENIRIRAIPLNATRMVHNSKYSLRNWLRESAKNFLPSSVEEKVDLIRMKIENGFGYYLTLTDKKLLRRSSTSDVQPVWTTGMAWIGDMFVIFSIFTNDPDSKVVDKGLKMVAESRQILTCEHGIIRDRCAGPPEAKKKKKDSKKKGGGFSLFR